MIVPRLGGQRLSHPKMCSALIIGDHTLTPMQLRDHWLHRRMLPQNRTFRGDFRAPGALPGCDAAPRAPTAPPRRPPQPAADPAAARAPTIPEATAAGQATEPET